MNNIPVQINSQITVTIIDLSHDGRGICRINGYVLFVAGALPGETCEIRVLSTKKSSGQAALVKIITPSPSRNHSFSAEPGCSLGHLQYSAQLKFKNDVVKNAIHRVAGLRNSTIQPTIPAPEQYHYRNKAIFHAGYDQNQKPVLGFYKEKSHIIEPRKKYLLVAPQINQLYTIIAQAVQQNRITPSCKKRNTGVLNAVLIRTSNSATMVCFAVKRSGTISQQLIQQLTIAGATSISEYIVPPGKKIDWANMTQIKGPATINASLATLNFQLAPGSFFQTNQHQAELLFTQAIKLAKLTKEESAVDIYCGTGTLTLLAAQYCKTILGVDIAKSAIIDAEKNKKANNIKNCNFIHGKAELIIPKIFSEKKQRPDLIFLDPPRQGCAPQLIKTILEWMPARIIYVSCNPATLARDIKMLTEQKYTLNFVQPIDMFPNTYHIECICSLSLY